MSRRLAILFAAGFAILWASASMGQPAGVNVPKEIAVPAGLKLLHKFDARGVQVYKAVSGADGKLEWALEGPLADLADGKGEHAGYHYDGPSWEAVDGSKLVRDKAEAVKSAPAPNPKDDIPWLLVKVSAETGKAGNFSAVTYIQRLQTVGGKAPAEAPKRVGTKVGAPYKAVYYLFGKA